MLRVAVVGAFGRMGATVCEAVESDRDLEVVARVGSGDSLESVLDAGADVAIEFTTPKTVMANASWLLERLERDGLNVVAPTIIPEAWRGQRTASRPTVRPGTEAMRLVARRTPGMNAERSIVSWRRVRI